MTVSWEKKRWNFRIMHRLRKCAKCAITFLKLRTTNIIGMNNKISVFDHITCHYTCEKFFAFCIHLNVLRHLYNLHKVIIFESNSKLFENAFVNIKIVGRRQILEWRWFFISDPTYFGYEHFVFWYLLTFKTSHNHFKQKSVYCNDRRSSYESNTCFCWVQMWYWSCD